MSGRVLRLAALLPVLMSLAVPAFARGQTSCSYHISLTSPLFLKSAPLPLTVNLITPDQCPWTAQSFASFLTVEPAAGTGPAKLTISATTNFTPVERRGTIRIADQILTVSQGRGIPIVDFNGDGKFDFVWRNRADGRISAWLMDGMRRIEGTALVPGAVTDTNWELVGSGDLDGDGDGDLVWQNNADGRVSAWLMNGLRQVSGSLLSIPQVTDTNWRIRALCDLNGDGRADLLWQHRTQGLVAVWLMNGFSVLDASVLRAPAVTDPNWRLVGVSEGLMEGIIYGYTGTAGAVALLWQHDGDGRLAVWYVRGLDLLGAWLTGETVSDTNWKIRALGDLDRDGTPDYIWQNVADGRLSVWFQGFGSRARLVLGTVPDLNWQLAGPR